MGTKRFIIEVEEGRTLCDKCPFNGRETCCYPYLLDKVMGCEKYNLATMKVKEFKNN